MQNYLDLLKHTLENGTVREDRTGTGTISTFANTLTFDLQDGFPAVTTKKLAFKTMMGELLWFLNGETRLSQLRFRTFGDANALKRTIWDANQKDYAERLSDEVYVGDDCGDIYGSLWHHEDQLREVVERLVTNPTDRRLLVSSWIPETVSDAYALALPPCHYAFQFYVRDGEFLDLMWHQRSGDLFLGIPFNIASYAALIHIIAAMTGYKPGRLTGTIGDTHIYLNHVEQVKEQLSRKPYEQLPTLVIPDKLSQPWERVWQAFGRLHDLTSADFKLEGYEHHTGISAPMAV